MFEWTCSEVEGGTFKNVSLDEETGMWDEGDGKWGSRVEILCISCFET